MSGPCKDHLDLIADQVLGLLDPPENEALCEHTQTCPACESYRQALQNDHDLLLDWGEELETAMSARIEKCVAVVVQETPPAQERGLPIRRRLKMSTLIKMAVAAVVVVGALIGTLLPPGPQTLSPMAMLAAVHAAEEALFTGEHTVYIRNEITVYPHSTFRSLGHTWLPISSLKADGEFRNDQLEMQVTAETYTVVDQAWYDFPTGRFVRTLETDDQVVFGNSYDGTSVYTTQRDTQGRLRVSREPIQGQFVAPSRPADFFGLADGLPSGVDEDTNNLIDVEQGTLDDGTAVHIYKVGTADPAGSVQAYFLFKVRDDDNTIAEKVFVAHGETVLVTRRVGTEQVDTSGIQWDMAELEGVLPLDTQSPQVTVNADMVISNVSVEHMVDRADFETYAFSVTPAWCDALRITDMFDPVSPGQRMFAFACPASDKRHVVMMQSPTYNKFMGMVAGSGTPIYTSPNGFKVISVDAYSTWLAGILLSSAQYEIKDRPAADCVCYILASPAGTYPTLAINGPLTDEELHALVDSLVPAKEYLQNVN
ncbi:zf-HC2 domain-containing protein [Planctomycetota bacterium]